MFKCADCGEKFETPIKDKEMVGERFGEFCYEDRYCCPYCDSINIDEGEICKMCGSFFDDCHDIANGFCKECVEKSYNTDIGIMFVEEKHLQDDFLRFICDGFDYIKMKLEAGDSEMTLNDIPDKLKEYCFDDWRDIAGVL